ncbi:XRE family transcriptional regulator [Streptomyces sp. tea 10]|nr:XRE family transcriptional regulator [Streptomyces sp. tea 10]
MNPTPPECARLAAELRRLRERSKLTLATLAEESAYSTSSWQRYLSGKALPPWLAVRGLCRLAGEPEPRMRALWELAEAEWSRRGSIRPARTEGQDHAPTDAEAVPPPAVRRLGRRRAWLVTVVGGVLAACAALAAVSTAGTGGGGGFHVSCSGAACNGQDPGVTLCGVEPQTLLDVVTPGGAGLEIRSNPLCRAAWARVWNTRLGDRLTLSTRGEPEQSVTVDDPSLVDAFVYTPLIALPARHAPLTACLTTLPGRTRLCYSAPAP